MELLLVNGGLEAARMGDRPALDRVLVQSRQNLRRHAECHCITHDVEDAVQESLLPVSRKLGDEEMARATLAASKVTSSELTSTNFTFR